MKRLVSEWECDICGRIIAVEYKNVHEQWYSVEIHPLGNYLNDPEGNHASAGWDACSMDCLTALAKDVALLVRDKP